MKRLSLSLILGLTFSCLFWNGLALADDPIVGEIRLYAGTQSVPDGWVQATGYNLDTDVYPELCNVLGNTYGVAPSGYCKLPDLRGRVAVGFHGQQGEFDSMGETGGERTHTLTTTEMPNHNHSFAIQLASGGSYGAIAVTGNVASYQDANTTYTGGGQSHNNLQPYITLSYIVFSGVY